MCDPKHNSQQVAVRSFLGLPVLMCRFSKPAKFGGPGSWEWGRWRFAKSIEQIVVNADLMANWK